MSNHLSIIGFDQLPQSNQDTFIALFPSSHREKNVTFFYNRRTLDMYMFSELWFDVYSWSCKEHGWLPSLSVTKEEARHLITKNKEQDSPNVTLSHMINKLTTEQYDALPSDIQIQILKHKLSLVK